MSDLIDSVLAEASVEPLETVGAANPEAENSENLEVEKPKDEAHEAEWPKKAANAVKRKNDQLRQLRFEKKQYERELQELREFKASQQQKVNQDDGRPKEADYESVLDYMEAVQDWKLGKLQSSQQKSQTESTQMAEAQRGVSERLAEIDRQAEDFIKSTQDADKVLQEIRPIVAKFPEHIRLALLEAENPTLAVYNLYKEDLLEDLEDMSPMKAAMAIGRAQLSTPVKKTTNAPAPLSPAKGRGASKSVETMDAAELMKWAGIR